jgi:hypothetical protein
MAEYVMLELIRLEWRPAKEAARYARGLFAHAQWSVPSLEECDRAIVSLCERKIVSIVDAGIQRQIAAYNRRFDGIGPTSGMPFQGELDFTEQGAELYRAMLNFEHPEKGTDYYWYHCGEFLYRRNATILIGYDRDWVLHDVAVCEFTPIGPVEEIGRWRNQWWREIPSGYRQRCLPILD